MLLGEEALLPTIAPEIALALGVTFPSGDVNVIIARDLVHSLLVGPGWGPQCWCPVKSIDSMPFTLPLAVDTIYIGSGSRELSLSPSPWCNPFLQFTRDVHEAFDLFKAYASTRADAIEWLGPLMGKRLQCECRCTDPF